jgi:hypothetical protein
MPNVDVTVCDALPPKAELNVLLRQFHDLIVQRMHQMGFEIDPAAPQSALAEFWA